MNIFLQRRLLIWGIIALIVLNVSVITAFWWGRPGKRPGPPAHHKLHRMLTERLNLSSGQQRQFRDAQKGHFEDIRESQNQLRTLKHRLFRQVLSEDVDSTKIEALTKAIGERQAEIDRKTFSHFRELRALCTPDQREKLNQLFDEVLRMMSPRHRPPHPPRKQNR